MDDGGYTTRVSYTSETGSSGTGVTIKPNGGDTGKTLFLPNAGIRSDSDGTALVYGEDSHSWAAEQYPDNTIRGWYLMFRPYANYDLGRMNALSTLLAYSIRCVRS